MVRKIHEYIVLWIRLQYSSCASILKFIFLTKKNTFENIWRDVISSIVDLNSSIYIDCFATVRGFVEDFTRERVVGGIGDVVSRHDNDVGFWDAFFQENLICAIHICLMPVVEELVRASDQHSPIGWLHEEGEQCKQNKL